MKINYWKFIQSAQQLEDLQRPGITIYEKVCTYTYGIIQIVLTVTISGDEVRCRCRINGREYGRIFRGNNNGTSIYSGSMFTSIDDAINTAMAGSFVETSETFQNACRQIIWADEIQLLGFMR